MLYNCKEQRCALAICLCVITVPSSSILYYHWAQRPVQAPAACDYPVLLTGYPLLHKDAAVAAFSIQRPIDTSAL